MQMSKKTHILILSSWYPTPNKPFLGNFVQRQAELLAKNYQVTILNTVAVKEMKNIAIQENKSGNIHLLSALHPKGRSILSKRREQISAFNKGIRHIKNVDLIIGHVALPKAWQFIEAKKKYKCPLFYIEHGSFFRKETGLTFTFIEKYLLKQLNKKASEIIAVSDILKKDMEKVFGESEIKVIANHVDQKLFSLSPERKNDIPEFLHISTLDEKTKNPKGIIRAFSLLKKEGVSFHLTIVSDENSQSIQDYALSEEVNDKITFIGPLQWEETVPFYHNADAFVLFSNYESFSIVLAESWMTGTPSISTPVGIASTENPQVGITVEKNNDQMLMESLREIALSPTSYDSKAIREFAKKYSSEFILNEWEQLITKYVD